MNTKTVFDRLQSIDDEVQKLHNTIFALKTTDIQAYADKYEELSISAALRSERIACQLRNLVYTTTDTGKKDYLKTGCGCAGNQKSLFQIVFFPLPCQDYCPNVNCEPTPLFYMSH